MVTTATSIKPRHGFLLAALICLTFLIDKFAHSPAEHLRFGTKLFKEHISQGVAHASDAFLNVLRAEAKYVAIVIYPFFAAMAFSTTSANENPNGDREAELRHLPPTENSPVHLPLGVTTSVDAFTFGEPHICRACVICLRTVSEKCRLTTGFDTLGAALLTKEIENPCGCFVDCTSNHV